MSYDATIAADSPAAWWKLSDTVGSGTAADSAAGGAHPLTATAVTFGQTGLPAGMAADTGAAFASASSSNCAETSWDGPASSPFSAEIWVNPNGLTNGNFAAFIGQGNAPSTSHGWLLQNDFGAVQFTVGNGTTSAAFNGGSIGTTGWVHVAGTYDGTTLKLYVNAVLAAFGSLAGPMVPQAGAGVTVGAVAGGNFWNGMLAQAAVYNVALTAAQVTNHYNNGTTLINPSVNVSPAALTVTQTATGTFGVSLSQAPVSNVTVATSLTSGNTGLTVASGSTLTFTPANWSTPQNVTVAADEASTGQAVFTASSAGYTSGTCAVTEAAGTPPLRAVLLALSP